jgi:tetratricopeptide (TPR) repeat protein
MDVQQQQVSDPAALVERLLRDAHIQRMRGEWSAAETLCRKALEVAPDDLMGVEMLGDILHERGKTEDALDLYRRAFAAQPEKGSLEEKIARMVLELAEEQRERDAAHLLLTTPANKQARKRNATLMILLSLCCPGLGQLFAGDNVKGGILLGVGLVTLLAGGGDLFAFLMQFVVLHDSPIDGFRAAIGMVGLVIYLYSLIDACTRASRVEKSLT